MLLRNVFPEQNIQEGIYALVGATATLAGVFRSSISLIVLIIEGKGPLFVLEVVCYVLTHCVVAYVVVNGRLHSKRLNSKCFLQHCYTTASIQALGQCVAAAAQKANVQASITKCQPFVMFDGSN